MTGSLQSIAFLRLLQENLFGPLATDNEAIDAEVERILLAQRSGAERDVALRALDLGKVPVPTPYESAQQYHILADVAEDILTTLAEDAPLAAPPLIGTLPLGWPMALLLREPGSGEHIAAVDDQLTTFANLLAKACAQGITIDWNDQSSTLHPGARRYVELVTAALLKQPSAAPVYGPDPEWGNVATSILRAIEVFVLAEPYVWLVEGDWRASGILSLPSIHPLAESYETNDSARFGRFVIRVAVAASVADRRGHDKGLACWGIEMFLRTLILLEFLGARLRGRAPRHNTFAQQELSWLRPLLLQFNDGVESTASALLTQLQPVGDAFEEAALFALAEAEGTH